MPMRIGTTRSEGPRRAPHLLLRTLAAGLALVAVGLAEAAHAQSGWPSWPWSQPERRPEQRPQPIQPQPSYQQPPAMRPPAPAYEGGDPRQRYCAQLEARLAQQASSGNQARDLLPKIDQEMRAADRAYQTAQSQMERAECFEYFLFAKSLKRTRQCYDLNKQVEDNRRRLGELEAQRQSLMGSRDQRSAQDELIQALARNGCGANYQQEAARRQQQGGPLGFLWQGDDEGGGPSGMRQNQSSLPFATYRTVCVRLCDGYYFPISYSTMQSQFQRDAQLCQQKCAAPAELFYYQNPGAEMEQAQSVNGQPYSKIPNAFRHRKEVVPGCSCKMADYQPELHGGKAAAPQRRTDAAPPATMGGTAPPAAAPAPPAPRRQAGTRRPGEDDDLIAQTIERTR